MPQLRRVALLFGRIVTSETAIARIPRIISERGAALRIAQTRPRRAAVCVCMDACVRGQLPKKARMSVPGPHPLDHPAMLPARARRHAGTFWSS